MKFPIKDLVTFAEEILNGKLHLLCSVCAQELKLKSAFQPWFYSLDHFILMDQNPKLNLTFSKRDI